MADQPVVSMRVGGRVLAGWLQSEVSVSIEALAGTFSVPATLVPGDVPMIKRQDEIEILVGDEVVITGYVMSADPFYDERDIGINVAGRDRTGDLVNSTAMHKGGQWKAVKIDRIVRDLVDPFRIKVVVAQLRGEPPGCHCQGLQAARCAAHSRWARQAVADQGRHAPGAGRDPAWPQRAAYAWHRY